MNIIAYMQGEPPSDEPAGVCDALRLLAIFVNDHAEEAERQHYLIPMIEPLMNTHTEDKSVLMMRKMLIARLLERMRLARSNGCEEELIRWMFLGGGLPEQYELQHAARALVSQASVLATSSASTRLVVKWVADLLDQLLGIKRVQRNADDSREGLRAIRVAPQPRDVLEPAWYENAPTHLKVKVAQPLHYF